MGGGAWPFLVGGAICLVNSVNERDLCCLVWEAQKCVILTLRDCRRWSRRKFEAITGLWCPLMFWAARALHWWEERVGQCLVRKDWGILKAHRAGDRSLELLIFNEEFLVSAGHQPALITSLPFVHTARRYYRLNGLVRPWEVPLREAGRNLGCRTRPNLII